MNTIYLRTAGDVLWNVNIQDNGLARKDGQ